MQNSAVVSRMSLKADGKTSSSKVAGDEPDKKVAPKVEQLKKPPIKRVPTTGSKANGPIFRPKTQQAPQASCANSATSVVSRSSQQIDVVPEGTTAKPRNTFTRPRLNRITAHRINRVRPAEENKPITKLNTQGPHPLPRTKQKVAKSCSETSMSVYSQLQIESTPCPQPLEGMQKQLEEMQTNFMEKVSSFAELSYGFSYKLVTVVHTDSCKVILHKDDLIPLPNNLPEHSVNEFKNLYHGAMKAGCRLIYEEFAGMTFKNMDEEKAIVFRDQLLNRLNGELDNKLVAIDNELLQMCQTASADDTAEMKRQITVLTTEKNQLALINSKLEVEIVDIRKSRDELRKLLDTSQKRNNDLALDLASKNIALVEQTGMVEDLRLELKQMKKTHAHTTKTMQQRSKENDTSMDAFRQTVSKQLERIEELETQLYQAQNDRVFLKKKAGELTLLLEERERALEEQKAQLLKLEETEGKRHSSVDVASKEKEAQLEQQQLRLSDQELVEKSLRHELQLKEEELHKAEVKVGRLEEQIEHHRQVLAVRGERINYLDQEMKQRELENNRKLTEIMAQTSDKNTLITQISNELASANEQFQSLCATLNSKQTKLHSQEHVIKLLEESNARSVKLHTKLGERNALLKDELDHLRRTVNNLMLGSDVSDTDVADILLE